MLRSYSRLAFTLTWTVFLAPLACGASSAKSASTNGVDDVGAACRLRAAWTQSSTHVCTTCIGIAIAPHCACETESYAGQCNPQEVAYNQEPSCSGVAVCVSHCVRTDCVCVEGCYAGKDACKTAAAALDGCTTEACDALCK